MTIEEWALAYVLRFGREQLGPHKPMVPGEREFLEQVIADTGVRDSFLVIAELFEAILQEMEIPP